MFLCLDLADTHLTYLLVFEVENEMLKKGLQKAQQQACGTLPLAFRAVCCF